MAFMLVITKLCDNQTIIT